jgi:hypothetical protein
MLKLRHRKIGRLHCERRKGAEAVGLRRTQFGKFLVVDLADRLGVVSSMIFLARAVRPP